MTKVLYYTEKKKEEISEIHYIILTEKIRVTQCQKLLQKYIIHLNIINAKPVIQHRQKTESQHNIPTKNKIKIPKYNYNIDQKNQ